MPEETSHPTVGLVAYGGYVPRLRLSRAAAVEANGWFNPALKGLAKGHRSMCNWDEDALTMAVEAARDCLNGARPEDLGAVHMASTSFPFDDRQNAAIAAAALNLPSQIATMDVAASQRAGTTGLLNALKAAGQGGSTLFLAADHRRAKAAGAEELQFGDGAAAFMVGRQDLIAELVAAEQVATDFMDHYRGQNARYDYVWEERWIRDEGFFKIVPPAVEGLLDKAGVAAADISTFVMPSAMRGVPEKIAQQVGIPADAVADTLSDRMGESGTAHALVLLAHALESAKPGDLILVVGWGQGCDALLFRATDRIGEIAPRRGVSGSLEAGREEGNYNRFLAFNGLVERDHGIRAEFQIKTPPSTLYRNREMVTGFVGGKCSVCGTVQFPKANYCVNPNCNALHSQEPHPMSEIPAEVQSWTADRLTYSPDPPNHFGMITFKEGGRLMADITDVDPGGLAVGQAMRMVFRIKTYDADRAFTHYFWKATPDGAAAAAN